MDKSKQFKEYREKYKEFYYNNYTIKEDEEAIHIEYEFEIANLAKFTPKIRILKKQLKLKETNSQYVKNMVFHIGLIELISYWKATCSPKVIIKCGKINEEQKAWWTHTARAYWSRRFHLPSVGSSLRLKRSVLQIGRASCRERV